MLMDLRYFLEMVDVKHRYGANLQVYHEFWRRQNTTQNFFYWLDHGPGLNLDLSLCSREKLDRERIRYLSREERKAYLVEVDDEGLGLCGLREGRGGAGGDIGLFASSGEAVDVDLRLGKVFMGALVENAGIVGDGA